MSFKPRTRMHRRRQAALRLESHDRCWSIWHPSPDEPIVIAEFADAACLALDLTEIAHHEVLVLLDEHRQVTAMLIDPPADVGVFVGQFCLPGVETPFCQTMSIAIDPSVAPGPPSDDDRRGYHALRRAHMAQGLLLLDALITDGDNIRSLAIGCDPDPIWFDGFEPPPTIAP
jgi:hypothetical protein